MAEFIIHKNNNILMSKVTQLAENSRQIKGMEVKIESLKNTIQKMKVLNYINYVLATSTLVFS